MIGKKLNNLLDLEQTQQQNKKEIEKIDTALDFLYNQPPINNNRKTQGGSQDSNPYVATWLGDIRKYFTKDSVKTMEKDAIEEKGLTELITDEKILSSLDKNVSLVSTIISLKDLIPEKTKSTARIVVNEIVEKLKDKFANMVVQSIKGAMKHNKSTALQIYKNIHWKKTIRMNLKNYDKEQKAIIPERFYFKTNESRKPEWEIVIVIDQSGSMMNSVVYSSIMASIFASIPSLKVSLLFFDTTVVDMTPKLVDPIDILFGVQLGGGTDITKAVLVAKEYIKNPKKTIFVLITDLYEGGSHQNLLRQLKDIHSGGTKLYTLLALDDTGEASFNGSLASKVKKITPNVFGCTPEKLVDLISNDIKNG